MENFTSINIPIGHLVQRIFFLNFQPRCVPCVLMCELWKVKSTITQLRMNWELIKSELEMN
jgi:hypothetical protein